MAKKPKKTPELEEKREENVENGPENAPENNLVFQQVFEVAYIPSVNSVLGVQKSGRRYLVPEAVEFRKAIQSQMIKANNRSFQNYDDKHGLVVSLAFVLRKNYLGRDVDNLIKETVDAVFQFVKVNDSRVTEVHAVKLFEPTLDKEYIKFTVRKSSSLLKEYKVKE